MLRSASTLTRTCIILVLLSVCMVASASSLQAGSGVYFESSNTVGGFDLCIWGLRFDLRFNALEDWLAFETPLSLGFDEDVVEFSVAPGVLFAIPVDNRMRLDLGVGTRMKVSLFTDGTWLVNGEQYGLTGGAVKSMKPDYRTGIVFDFEKVAVRTSVRVPTEGTFDDLSFTPDWDEAKVGLSILISVA